MIIDSSAIVAVLLVERGADRLITALKTAPSISMSAVTLVEASVVMARYHGDAGVRSVDRLLAQYNVGVEAVTTQRARSARSSYLRFGKGRHPAALNFGDCFSHALATERDEPLLFVGDDFARTDVRVTG